MEQKEVKDFCRYEVYEIIDNKEHTICLCNTRNMADTICKLFALNDSKGKTYFYTNVQVPNTFVVGGGWFVGYSKNKEGKLNKIELS